MTVPEELELPRGARLVHIGPPKTGTTAIQRALHEARAELREHGVVYPGHETRPRAAGWAIVGAGVPRGRAKPTMADWDELVREVEAAGDDRVAVSNESFALAYHKAARKIVEGLGGERVHIVYVVRRVDKLLNSHWQQRVQAGLTVPYDDWLRIALGTPDQDNPHWRGFWRHHALADVMRRWVNAAGSDKVTLVIADESDRELLPRLFERFLALPEGLLRLDADPANRSLSLNEIEMVRRIHQRGVDRSWSDHALRHLMQFGVVSSLTGSPRRDDDRRIALPPWASKRAAEINDERIELVRSLGVRVIGDPENLRSEPRSDDDSTEPGELTVATDLAAEAIAAAIDAGERRRRVAIQRGERRVADAAERLAEARRAEQEAGSPEDRRVRDVSSRELLRIVRSRINRRVRRTR